MSSRPRSKRRYNWLPDLPDQRDLMMVSRFAPPKSLPAHVDLRPLCPPVVDQGQIGSCTGNALAGAIGFLEIQELRAGGAAPAIYSAGTFEAPSRLFIYYNERDLEGTVDQDAGAKIRDGIKTLAAQGVCRESVWKYLPDNVFKKPLPKAFSEAKKHQISSYLKIASLAEGKACLAQGFPFVFGFSVYESFESPDVARTGVMPMPGPSERLLGGHAVMAVGYDEALKALWVRNSWGSKWGVQGYFRMPYAYITERKLAQDFWTVRGE